MAFTVVKCGKIVDTLVSTGRRRRQKQLTEIACEHCSAAGAAGICVQGLWYCTPTCKVKFRSVPRHLCLPGYVSKHKQLGTLVEI